jgi:hypothetical protein
LPLVDTEHAPPGRLAADQVRTVGAIDDAWPDRWGKKVIRYIDKPKRHSIMSICSMPAVTSIISLPAIRCVPPYTNASRVNNVVQLALSSGNKRTFRYQAYRKK